MSTRSRICPIRRRLSRASSQVSVGWEKMKKAVAWMASRRVHSTAWNTCSLLMFLWTMSRRTRSEPASTPKETYCTPASRIRASRS